MFEVMLLRIDGGIMNFNSFGYAIFLPIVFFLYWGLPHRYRWGLLLVASYYFYMSWNPQYIVLIFGTTVVSYLAALLVERCKSTRGKKIILSLATFICLGVLFWFKYFNFMLAAFVEVCSQIAIELHPITLNVLLPVGISFYTFQTLGYVIDVYRGKVKAEIHFGEYAAFVSFFPQLVAGPIERAGNLLTQIKTVKNFSYDEAAYGLRLMAWGFFKKMVVADNAAPIVDSVFSSPEICTGFDLLVAMFFFTLQIYCDFSGYSDIAIGTAHLLGIKLMSNFKSPYFAGSFKEFWSRWHISLSIWFRDYLYIPLGGNRSSRFRHNLNIMITFLISGLWHGANWTFVLWGGIHGVIRVIENILHFNIITKSKLQKIISIVTVFAIWNIIFVFFRSRTIAEAFYILGSLVPPNCDLSWYIESGIGIENIAILHLLIPILLVMVYDFVNLKRDVIHWVGRQSLAMRWLLYFIIIFWTILEMPLESSSFIYFQF